LPPSGAPEGGGSISFFYIIFKRSFVVVDCTALPETLVESILFGHARGAFAGAETSEEGLIKQADMGTLF